ncbi:MAG: ribonuclease [Lachnospiraceae bacterium]|nr:ribonuclease [Lachnospiraceae bacterium]
MATEYISTFVSQEENSEKITDNNIDNNSENVTETVSKSNESENNNTVTENGVYSSKDEIALYIHIYGKLPVNFISKSEARKLGWNGGSLEKYAKGKCIGGDRFGNYEKKLPTVKGRNYFECDVNTLGAKSRGAERIIYSNDGYIYYTADHYKSFTVLYEGDK